MKCEKTQSMFPFMFVSLFLAKVVLYEEMQFLF